MRQVGDRLARPRAERFVAFLAAQGIEAETRDDGDDRASVWVIDEDRLPAADEHFRAYKVAPDAKVFDAPAPAPRRGSARPTAARRSRYIDVRTEVFGRGRLSKMPVTLFLIMASVALTLVSGLPGAMRVVRALYYSEYYGRDFPEISAGEVWRLVTPIFLHGGVLHLLFNMLWLYQLGGAIETNEGSLYLAAFTVGAAAIVDTLQYLVSGPLFLGMSGIVYAFLGYIWMMARYKAGTRYFVARETVIIMLFWIVICFTPLMQGVANTEHVAGLLLGVAFGFLRSGYLLTLLRRRRYRG
jgi:membrane associated rhomboid family serine protease